MKPETNELQMPAGRVIFIRTPRRLTAAQTAQALQSMADDDPRWLVIHQFIDEELASAMLDSSSETLSSRRVRHAGGRVAALSQLKQRLYEERSKPMVESVRRSKK